MLTENIYNAVKNIPVSTTELELILGKNTLARAEQAGDIIRLKRGLYVVNSSIIGCPPSAPICSNRIYGPSYLSMQWVLSYYGLIPEQAKVYTAMTIKHGRSFENKLGLFTYSQVPVPYFSIGLISQDFDGVSCIMATPEKALADMILFTPYIPHQSLVGLARFLEEDIRLDMDSLRTMDVAILQACAQQGKKTGTLTNLLKLITKIQ